VESPSEKARSSRRKTPDRYHARVSSTVRYQSARRPGASGPGIHLARDRRRDDAPCALEIAPRPPGRSAPLDADLAREAARCAAVTHHALARPIEIFACGTASPAAPAAAVTSIGAAYEGGGAATLAELVAHLARRGERLGGAAAGFLGHQIAGALAEAHAALDGEDNLAPVIHGRLRPEVVLLDEDGAVRVAGAGLLAFAGVHGLGGACVSPEQQRGARVTLRVDVYALGTLLRALFDPLPAELPAELRAALGTATEAAPDRRRITCAELQAWLARFTDLEAGRGALGAAVRALVEARAREAAPLSAASRPLSWPARVGVAAVTAAVVIAAGVLAVERGEHAFRRPRGAGSAPAQRP
jgi:hypothetical protein